jgi:thiol-disulfide isomerase/thioredoxin
MNKKIILVVVLILIVATIVYLERGKVESSKEFNVTEIEIKDSVIAQQKALKYRKAAELVNPNGYLNSDNFTIAQYIGKKVILIDFWTYSCINCLRTLPYLNSWNEKYGQDGLLIVGVHSPEFDFEKDYNNVKMAVEKNGIKYPIVLDNEHLTWDAYINRFWPHKYLIDIDGFIVYDHIGEGRYNETESEIQKALLERRERLG